MSKGTPKSNFRDQIQRMNDESKLLIKRVRATLQHTREAIKHLRETGQADASLARTIDAANNDMDDGSARA
jgi:signal transduction histidine kinase